MKDGDGGVVETSFRFQAAADALNQPPVRPTRGSGVGAAIDMSGAGEVPPDDDIDEAQPAAAMADSRRETARSETGRDGVARWAGESGGIGGSEEGKGRTGGRNSGQCVESAGMVRSIVIMRSISAV
jgi:hypothetical protein